MLKPPNKTTVPFDFSNLGIATAESSSQGGQSTGCTVLLFPEGASAAIDVRGGSAATRESTLLDPLSSWNSIQGICLAGGSTYGLAAADGVMQLLRQEANFSTAFEKIPSVPAAVVYDFQDRTDSSYPDASLGFAAAQLARKMSRGETPSIISVGAIGAGSNVHVGKFISRTHAERGGQGAAFLQAGPWKMLAVTILNSLGNILGPSGEILAGSREPRTGKRLSLTDSIEKIARLKGRSALLRPSEGNTTLTVLVTNAPLDRTQLQRLAVQAHTGMARVIEPFHTPYDGDVLFAVSVSPPEAPRLHSALPMELGLLGIRAAHEAVWSLYPRARPTPG